MKERRKRKERNKGRVGFLNPGASHLEKVEIANWPIRDGLGNMRTMVKINNSCLLAKIDYFSFFLIHHDFLVSEA